MSSTIVNLEEEEPTIIAETLPIIVSSSSSSTTDTSSNMIKFVFSPTVSDGQELISAEEKIDRTGLLVWRGARVFYEYLYSLTAATNMIITNNTKKQSSSPTATKMKNKSRIVELGAGIGFGSVVAGCFLRSFAAVFSSSFSVNQHEIICTDFFEPALELAQQQIRVNKLEDSISTVLLDWCWALSEKDDDRQRLDAFISRHIVNTSTIDDQQHNFISTDENDHDENKNTPFSPSSSNLTLLALDCCYPDTRNDVLCGLFVTIGKLLKMKQTQDEFLSSSSLSSPHLIMTFVERDVGLTLRRLIIAASLCGLQVDPLELPILASPEQECEMFNGHTSFCSKTASVNSSLSIQDLLLGEDFASSSLHFKNNNIDSHIASIWSILQESFLKTDTSDNKKKSTFATSNASWILRIKLAASETPAADGTCHQKNFDLYQQYLSHEGTFAIAQNCSRVIEMLTSELSSLSSSSSPDAETSSFDGILHTLHSEEYLLAKSHFNSKWFATFPYLCYGDSYAAARSIVTAVKKINCGNIEDSEDENKPSTKRADDFVRVTEDFELSPLLLSRVLAERHELESDDWMRQISDLF